MIQNIDLIYYNNILSYINISNFSYDSESGMVWFTDSFGNKHEAHVAFHMCEERK